MPTYEESRAGYAAMWARATIKIDRLEEDKKAANLIISHKFQYEEVERATGVPWFFVGCLHHRESNCDFTTHLHNGDSLDGFTHHVPAGRPQVGHQPPFTWVESAIDALRMHKLDQVRDWTAPSMLYRAEDFNGWGYTYHNENSPYDWGGTNLQQPGKFTSDHGYDPSAMDRQLGVAAILKELCALDAQINARVNGTAPPPPPKEQTKMTDTTTAPAVIAPAANDPIPGLIAGIEKVHAMATFAAPWVPAPYNLIITAGIPALEEALQMIEDVKAGGANASMLSTMGAHLIHLGTQMQATHAQLTAPAVAQQAPAG